MVILLVCEVGESECRKTMENKQQNCSCPSNVVNSVVLLQESSISCRGEGVPQQTQAKAALGLVSASDCVVPELYIPLLLANNPAYLRGY